MLRFISRHVIIVCLTLCPYAVKKVSAQTTTGTPQTQVNYCRLVSGGIFYGYIESEYSGRLPQEVTNQFNGKWQSVYSDNTFQQGITRDELTDDKRFSYGNTLTFPDASNYHSDQPNGYQLFHLAREAGKIQSPSHAACVECVSESINIINTLLRGTRLEQQLGDLWVGSGIIKRINTTQDVKDLVFYLKCLFYDAMVNPASPPSGQNLPPLLSVPDTTIIVCKTEINPEIAVVWRHCELAGKLDTIGPIRISGINDCPGTIYRYTFIARDVCNRTDSIHQFFVIENDLTEIRCPGDTVVTCIDQLNTTIKGSLSSCGMMLKDSVYGPVLIAGTHNCPDAVYQMEYFVVDSCSRFDGCIQMVQIDNEPPRIDCPPDEVVSCPDQIKPSAPSLTIACNLGYDVTTAPPVLVSGQGTCPGDIYEIRYTVNDICGRANSCIQQFVIDNSGPVIRCPPDEFVLCIDDINTGIPEIMKAACDIQPLLEVSEPVLVSGVPECAFSEYLVTYTITDECGRTASCGQVFTMIDVPVEVDCPGDRIVKCKDEIEAEPPVVRSACPVAYNIDQSGPRLVQGSDNCPGAIYEIHYQYRDACGDEKLCIQRFTIENDPPEISCPPERIVESFDDIEIEQAMIQIACDLGYVLSHDGPILVSGTENCQDAIYEITYRLEDICGRKTECVQRFRISNAGPEITCPDSVVIVCVDDIVAGDPEFTVSKGLGFKLERDSVPRLISGKENCPGAVYAIEYLITDDCGRTATCYQYFVIETNDPPTIICPPDKIVKCSGDIWGDSPVYTSACDDAELDIHGPELIHGTHNCPGAVYRVTYTARDSCGRTASCEQLYTLAGEPIVILCPPDTTIMFGDNIEVVLPVIRGSCLQPYKLESIPPVLVSGTEGLPGAVYYLRHLVTDNCNNSSECTQRIDIVGPIADGPESLCDCYKNRPVALELVEDRTDRFLRDVAELTKIHGCKKMVEWAKSDVKSLWDAWSTWPIIGGDVGYASQIAQMGSIDLIMQNIPHIDKAIKSLEEAISGDPRKAIEILSEHAFLEVIKRISSSGTPGLIYNAIKSLGDFAKYLNREIVISNIKTYADYADRDPHIFHPDTFLLKYAKIREIKPGDPDNWNDLRNVHRIHIYDYAQVNNQSLPNAREIWEPDKRKMNTLRAMTKTMLNEVCDYWCYRKSLENEWNKLRHEQSVLNRFHDTWKHISNTTCAGDVVCDIPNAEIRNIAGVDTCECIAGYMWDPGRTRCIPYEDCTLRPNTISEYQGDRYVCVCQQGYIMDPDNNNCVPDIVCDPALNVTKVYAGSHYECDCLPGYLWDPGNTRCVPYDDCGIASHVNLAYDGNRYVCICEQGYRWSPDRTDCVPAQDCSTLPHTAPVFMEDHYACDCIPGYKWDPDGTKCVTAQDCTSKPNTQQIFRQNAYVCECLPGFVMRADGSGCDPQLDCSAFPNSLPVWNAAINDYECDCKQGYRWNADFTTCEAVIDCSTYPNSVPVWNPAIGDYECDCPQGFAWNNTYSACVESAPDCGFFYANTMAVFNPATNQYECDCLPGYTWNATFDGCVESQVMTCDIPNTVLLFDRINNQYYCECEPGYRWNARKTQCIKRPEPMDPETARDILTGLVDIMSTITGGQDMNTPVVKPEHQRTGKCNVTYGSGANAPEQITIDVYQAFGSVSFEYETYTVKDRIQIYNGARLILDTGCVGTQGWRSTTLQISGSSIFRIVVNPLCDPSDGSNTAWQFKLGCP